MERKSLSHYNSGNPELKLNRLYEARGESGGGRKDGISRVRVHSSRLIENLLLQFECIVGYSGAEEKGFCRVEGSLWKHGAHLSE